jgi:peroxiredoxin
VLRKLASGIAVAGALGLLLLFASPSYRQGEPSIVGRRAPDFSFTHAGKTQRLSELRGKVVVLNFWATWCPPCVEEMPSLEALHRELADEGGMVLGVSVDENAQAYEEFLQRFQITFPNHRDPNRELAAKYGTVMFPETYILDREGRIAKKIIGAQDWMSAEQLGYLRSLLERR